MSADDDDDEQLKSLRSVWVSMRESDEDPPDRGLAALMDAAREKASAMAEPPRESWWQKVLATLRRPPVLALASVMVLLGGALFVMQRSDKLSSGPEAEEKQAPAPAQTELAPAPPPGASAAAGSASAVEVPAVIAAPDPAPPEPSVMKPPRAVKPPRMRPASPPPPAEPVKTEAATGGVLAADKDKRDDGELAKKPEPATTGTTRGPVRIQESMEPTTDSFGAVDVKASAQTKRDEGGDRSKLVTQLVKQCESAAARGDCAAVRVIAGRIKSEDSSAYSQRVVKNSSIARCLEPASAAPTTTVK